METQASVPGTQGLDTWAIVEMFGHKRLAGKLSEHVVGSSALIRVDVPETQLTDDTKSQAFTKFLGAGSIYCITPCSEEVARAAATRIGRYDPPIPLEFQPQRLAAGETVTADVIDDDDEDAFDDLDLDDEDVHGERNG